MSFSCPVVDLVSVSLWMLIEEHSLNLLTKTTKDWRVMEMFSSVEEDRFSSWSSSSRPHGFQSSVSHWRRAMNGSNARNEFVDVSDHNKWSLKSLEQFIPIGCICRRARLSSPLWSSVNNHWEWSPSRASLAFQSGSEKNDWTDRDWVQELAASQCAKSWCRRSDCCGNDEWMYDDALENVRQCVGARRERKRLTGVCAMMAGRHWRTPPEMSRSGTSARLPHPHQRGKHIWNENISIDLPCLEIGLRFQWRWEGSIHVLRITPQMTSKRRDRLAKVSNVIKAKINTSTGQLSSPLVSNQCSLCWKIGWWANNCSPMHYLLTVQSVDWQMPESLPFVQDWNDVSHAEAKRTS